MATVKIKFRPSTAENREGTVYYQVIHNRIARQIKTGIHLFPNEWDGDKGWPVSILPGREGHIKEAFKKIEADISKIRHIISGLDQRGTTYSSEDVVRMFRNSVKEGGKQTFFSFMRSVIEQMRANGRTRISETYTCALNSFVRFRKDTDLLPEALDSDIIEGYEAYLKGEGVCRNTSSFYMRNLRSVYNRAVNKGLTAQRDPFRNVYTGIDKTVKRALPLPVIRKLRGMDLSGEPHLELARDLFLFSFYTRGMSFIDMAYLRKSDLQNGILSYRRKKTGQRLTIRWEECMKEIVTKYDNRDNIESDYLLPIIIPGKGDALTQYRNMSHLINRRLKVLGERLKLSVPLTMYCARHAWASIARSKNIPISVISEGMGHDSEATTRIYLASLDSSAVDKANRLVLKSL